MDKPEHQEVQTGTSDAAVFAFNHWQFRTKILVIIFLVAFLSAAALTIYNYITLSTNTYNATGAEMANYAREAVDRQVEIVAGSVKALEVMALSPTVVEAVEKANQSYAGKEAGAIQEELGRLDQAWQDGDTLADPLVASIEDNPTSDFLRSFMQSFPEEVEVFVTDMQGANIAMSGRTGDYIQSDEDWWLTAYANGRGQTYTGEVELDESAGIYAMNIGVPVRSPDGEVLGVLRGTVDISVVFEAASAIRMGESGRAVLLDKSGRMLYTPEKEMLMEEAPQNILELIAEDDEGYVTETGDVNGRPSIMAYYRQKSGLADTLGWTLVIYQARDEISRELAGTFGGSLIFAAILLVIMMFLGMAFAASITGPLNAVKDGMLAIAQGNLKSDGGNVSLEKVALRRDEIGLLGKAQQETGAYLRSIADAAAGIAGGDLRMEITPRGESDELGQALSLMLTGLRESVGQVSGSASALAFASDQLSQAANQAGQATNQIATTVAEVTAGLGQQANDANRSATAADQMDRAIDGVAKGAQEQAQAVAEASRIMTQFTDAFNGVQQGAQEQSE